MVFSSLVFVGLFLPLFLAGYYLTPARWRSLFILLGSYLFYGWWRVDFLLLFVFVTLFSYAVSLALRSTLPARRRKQALILGVAGNLSVLAYFKYFNFGIESFQALAGGLGLTPWEVWSVILPIGISFYIFQAISYLVDVYRGDAEIAESFLDFAAFIAFFPQLIAGPVLRYKDLAGQFRQRDHTLDKFNEGALRFASGFCKKVVLADTIAPIADLAFAQSNPSFLDAWLGALAYSAQLYLDFSGYSDMAIGIGLMLGFRFIENFNHPYISQSITEFWRRWHISLSTWLRDYLYVPLGGNRKGSLRTYVNLMVTMLLGGLWHGANWTFVAWGAWHGLLLALERLLGGKAGSPYPRLLAGPITLLLVIVGWVMFRAESVGGAVAIYRGMLGFNGWGLSDHMAWAVTPLQAAMLVIAYVFIYGSALYQKHRLDDRPGRWARTVGLGPQVVMIPLLVLGVSKMVSQSYSPFLYFQF